MNKNLPVHCSTHFSMVKKKKKKGKEQIINASVVEKRAREKAKSLLKKSTKFMYVVCAPFMVFNFLSNKFS